MQTSRQRDELKGTLGTRTCSLAVHVPRSSSLVDESTSLCFTRPKSPSVSWNLVIYEMYSPLLLGSSTCKEESLQVEDPRRRGLSTLQPHTNYLEGLPEKPKPPHDNLTCQSLFSGVPQNLPAAPLHSLK
ncbi:hypothetical protein AMECASPLE_025962 [Ameca splendens]|uniref:Uncharacterized protein n=1 Tax=Ameca splendens TaxID=208324 RepID=A0ABV0ZQ88_9TELE